VLQRGADLPGIMRRGRHPAFTFHLRPAIRIVNTIVAWE
jgi:hypothetical protein